MEFNAVSHRDIRIPKGILQVIFQSGLMDLADFFRMFQDRLGNFVYEVLIEAGFNDYIAWDCSSLYRFIYPRVSFGRYGDT